MITTKAYITSVPEIGENTFKVNIPLMADNVSEEAIFDALLCSSSGSYNDYKVGDCVFVDFEDDKYNTAIILGKLYTEVPEENNTYGLFNQLKVTGFAELPENTRIGQYSPQDFFNLYQAAENFNNSGNDYVTYFKLKEFLSKVEFNEFYGDKYFLDIYPFSRNSEIKIDNELEKEIGEEEEKDIIYNEDYNPDYSTLKNNWKDFIIYRFTKFLGLNETKEEGGEEKTTWFSFLTILKKMEEEGSQDFQIDDLDDPGTPVVEENYFPTYKTLVSNLKEFFTNLPELFVRFYKEDNIKAKKLKVCTEYNQPYPSGDTDDETIYFCTYVPRN